MCKYLSDSIYLWGHKGYNTGFNCKIKALGETVGCGILMCPSNSSGEPEVLLYSRYPVNDVYNPRSTIMCVPNFSITIHEVAGALKVISIASWGWEAKALLRSTLQKWQCPDRTCSFQLLTFCLPSCLLLVLNHLWPPHSKGSMQISTTFSSASSRRQGLSVFCQFGQSILTWRGHNWNSSG